MKSTDSKNIDFGQLLTIRQVADRTGMSENSIRCRIYDGELEAVDLRSSGASRARFRVSESALSAWLEGRMVVSRGVRELRERQSRRKRMKYERTIGGEAW